MLKLTTTEEDFELIVKIVERTKGLVAGLFNPRVTSLQMDITACHLNGCPLDLKKLLQAPDKDLVHDG